MRSILKHLLLLLLLPGLCGAGEEGEKEQEKQRTLTADDIPARIAEAEVGEWVLYKMPDGTRSRLIVVEHSRDTAGEYVVIRNEVTKPKRKRPVVKEERVYIADAVKDLRKLGEEDFITESTVLVRGARVEAVIVHRVENGQVVSQSYLSDQIPVHGLLRGVNPKNKQSPNTLTAIDYGFADDE